MPVNCFECYISVCDFTESFNCRGGGQESFAGPLARLLGATPALLKEARKRFGSSGMSENDLAEKRR